MGFDVHLVGGAYELEAASESGTVVFVEAGSFGAGIVDRGALRRHCR